MLITEFEKRVREHPDRVAVRSGDNCLTYRELDLRARNVAGAVHKHCPRDGRVGLLFEQGSHMIVAMLAVLKAGRVYVPLAADYPDERIACLLKDSQASLLLTTGQKNFTGTSCFLELGIEWFDICGLQERGNGDFIQESLVKSSHPAYIMYTSGSTGRPKGVLQTHENVNYFVKEWRRLYNISAGDHMTLFSSFCHDGSVQDIYSALLSGAVLYPMDMKKRDNNIDLSLFLLREDITIWHSVPSVFSFFTASLEGNPRFNRIRYIILGGEAVRRHELLMQRTYFPNSSLANVYGQTESSVNAVCIISPAEEVERIMIGHPLQETEIYVVDDQGEPVEPLETGELLVVSNYISPGYWCNEDATDAVFGYDEDSGSYYWTGDLGCLHPNGDIEFLGRKDRQVKIRGYRIEPGEIESRLLKYKGIEEAVVLDRIGNDEETYLCAYLRGKGLNGDYQTHLRDFVSKKLPEYMIPAFFVTLDEFPRTSSGKIDRKEFPEPGTPKPGSITPPQNTMQEKMRELWAGLLGLEKEKIGVDHNFFELGGHSLKAVSLTARIQKSFNVKVNLSAIFDTPTIRGLCEQITGSSRAGFESIQPAEEREYYPLTPAQLRFFMMQALNPQSKALNITLSFPLDDSIDMERLSSTLAALVVRHESLRTSFRLIDGIPVQIPHAAATVNVPILESDSKPIPQPFDLERAPLIRVAHVQNENRNVLVVEMHHIISDGTSNTILIKDFAALYGGEKLPPLTLRYRDFALWQVAQLKADKYKEQESYWLKRLQGPLPALEIPADFPRPKNRTYDGGVLKLNLGSDLTARIRSLALETGTTLYMILLAAFNILLSRLSARTDIIVGSPLAGRSHADLEGVIGLVIGSVLLRNTPESGETFKGFLNKVKNNTLIDFENQDYPFEELLKKLDWQEESGKNPITNVALILQNILTETPGSRLQGKSGIQSNQVEAMIYPQVQDVSSKLDLTLTAYEGPGEIFLDMEFSRELFRDDRMRIYAGYLINILDTVTRAPGILLERVELDAHFQAPGSDGRDINYSPLSHPQKRIYYTEKIYPGTPCNNLSFSVHFQEILDEKFLQDAVNRVLERNDGLRLQLVEIPFQQEPRQYIAGSSINTLEKINLTGKNQDQLLARKAAETLEIIDRPLYYFAYLLFGPGESGFFLKLHHLVSDGWSLLILIREIVEVYDSLKRGEAVAHQGNPSYLDFLQHEREYLFSEKGEKDLEFWLDYLEPLPEPFTLGGGSRVDNRQITAGKKVFALNSDLRQRLHEYKNQHSTSIYKMIFSALAFMLARISGEKEAVIAGSNHNRGNGDFLKSQGMFVATLPFRVNVDMELDFSTFLQDIGQKINYIIKNHGQYPFDLLAKEMKERHGSNINYLLDINLVGHPDILPDRYRSEYYFTGFEPSPLAIHINVANKDITGILELEWDYRYDSFSSHQIESMQGSLVHILDQVIAEPTMPLMRVDLLTPAERVFLMEEFNNTGLDPDYPPGSTIISLIEGQAERKPYNLALTGDQQMTYDYLVDRAGALAAKLIDNGVGPGHIVGLILKPSVERAVAILGVLKAGAAYLPIESGTPEERISYMLSDSAARLVLEAGEYPVHSFPGVEYLSLSPESLEEMGSQCPVTATYGPSLPAYLIYTSGSTGHPKGVVVEQSNLMAYVGAFLIEFPLSPADTVIQQASYAFDAFVEEFYPILVKGGKVALSRRETIIDPHLLAAFIARYRVTMISASPRLLNELNNLESGLISSLRIIISGGDTLLASFIDRLIEGADVYNTYGPTETTVCAAYFRCNEEILNNENIPIGRPITGYRLFIHDPYGNPLPRGIAGELVIAGVGVARGYLNRPELTWEKFNEGMYRSGDLCRINNEGFVEFLGRIDRQVQIRGFRVEPGEVEKALAGHQEIRDAVVTTRLDEQGETYFCAYYIPVQPGEIHEFSKLRDYLGETLPAYMIPSSFTMVNEFPMTPSGKIDRNALPAPGVLHRTGELTPPETKTQEILVTIWQDILFGTEKEETLGIDDDFFALGGHSLKATRLITRIEREMGVRIALAMIFSNPTIRKLSTLIDRAALDGEQGAGLSGSTPTVLLKNASHDSENLFLIHEGSGEVDGYREFCLQIKVPIRCWGIRAQGFNGIAPANINIEDLAREYIGYMKKVQPHGPYRLLGWSIGGTIAFEIIRQLERSGSSACFFAMIDSLPPKEVDNSKGTEFTVPGDLQWLNQWFRGVENMKSLNESQSLEEMWNRILQYLESNPQNADRIRQVLSRSPGFIIPGGNQLPIDQVVRYLNINRSLGRARDCYRPKQGISLAIQYIQPTHSLVEKPECWGDYTSGEIITRNMGGDHYSIFKQPEVIELAGYIASILE